MLVIFWAKVKFRYDLFCHLLRICFCVLIPSFVANEVMYYNTCLIQKTIIFATICGSIGRCYIPLKLQVLFFLCRWGQKAWKEGLQEISILGSLLALLCQVRISLNTMSSLKVCKSNLGTVVSFHRFLNMICKVFFCNISGNSSIFLTKVKLNY